MKKYTTGKEVLAVYLKLLEEEQGRPDTKGKRGLGKNARRRAMDRTTEQFGFADWRSVRRSVVVWERDNDEGMAGFEDFGIEMEPELLDEIRGKRLEVQAALRALTIVEENTGKLSEIRRMLEGKYPTMFCPYCKAVVDCDVCEDGINYGNTPAGLGDGHALMATDEVYVDSGGVPVLLSGVLE